MYLRHTRYGRSAPALIFLILFACLGPMSGAYAEEVEGEYRAGHGRFQARLVPERDRFLVGEPFWLHFEVKNVGEKAVELQTNLAVTAMGRSTSFDLEVRDVEMERQLPRPDTGPVVGSLGSSVAIPPGETWRKSLFLPFWATIDRPGTYLVTCRTTLIVRRVPPDRTLQDPSVETRTLVRLEARAADPEAMGKVIEGLGRSVLRETDEEARSRAIRSLHQFEDPRAVPWWLAALESGDSHLMYEAAWGLGACDDASAVEGLLRATRTQARDVKNAMDAEHAVRAAGAIRSAAVRGLGRSPHPPAAAAFLDLSAHADPGVRKAVARLLGDRSDPESLVALRKLTKDREAEVREVAGQSLRYRER